MNEKKFVLPVKDIALAVIALFIVLAYFNGWG